MRCVLQRVHGASVRLQTAETHGINAAKNHAHPVAQSSLETFESTIHHGVVALVGIQVSDSKDDIHRMAKRILSLRLWPNEDGKPWAWNVSQAKGQILCVSQFTLCARNKKGTKLDFSRAMPPDQARAMYDEFLATLRGMDPTVDVKDGVFGAMMDISLVNDGPVTILLDSTD
jgi:D-tyrosyl-tRNA(Tyr) deacylase